MTFVGECPTRDIDERQPLSGRSGRRLASLLEVGWDDFIRMDRVNLCGTLDYDPSAAKIRADQIAAGKGDLILLGQRVASAFGLPFAPLSGAHLNGRRVLIMPHPSGRNRWWNDQSNCLAAGRMLRTFVYGSKAASSRRLGSSQLDVQV